MKRKKQTRLIPRGPVAMMSHHFASVGTSNDCVACGQHFEARAGGMRVEVGVLCHECDLRWVGDRKFRNRLRRELLPAGMQIIRSAS